jgi:phosphatidylserine decarboxylase
VTGEPIRYWHRARQRVETEEIYGERWLRWLYETRSGRAALAALVRRPWISAWYGWRMNRPASARRIAPFVARYGLDVGEFAAPLESYRTFNEFFFRRLRPGARPIDPAPEAVVLPADGRHLAFPDVDAAAGFYVKGAKFTLAELLGTPELAARFAGGTMLVSRLCPVDYHRFHFPCAGTPQGAQCLGRWLYSVSPVALRRNIRYLVENRRCLTLLSSPVCGEVAIVEIGATMVGGIEQTYVHGQAVAKGQEKGYFRFGGSCTITLFARDRVRLDEDLVAHSRVGLETYALMGQRCGTARAAAG